MSLRAYPKDAPEHELETLSAWLRSFDDCPQEVRIREEEGSFIRPMLFISLSDLGKRDHSRYYYEDTRVANVTWYGTKADVVMDHHREAWRIAEWLTSALIRNDDYQRGLVQILDWSTPEDPQATDHWMFIDDTSVAGKPERDDYGQWFVPIDFEYTVERGYTPTYPTITTVDREVHTQ